MTILTTLNHVKKFLEPDPFSKLLAGLGKTAPDDEPLDMLKILEINGLDDCLWAFDYNLPRPARRLLAVVFAKRARPLMTDRRSIDALDVAERHANGLATDQEFEKARNKLAVGSLVIISDKTADWPKITVEWLMMTSGVWVIALTARLATADEESEHAAQTEIVREFLTTGKIGEVK